MKYESICRWRDITDKHLYQSGDAFPHDGREVPADRLESLISGKNGAGIAVIKAVEEVVEPVAEKPVEKPVEKAEKKTTRSRKKT